MGNQACWPRLAVARTPLFLLAGLVWLPVALRGDKTVRMASSATFMCEGSMCNEARISLAEAFVAVMIGLRVACTLRMTISESYTSAPSAPITLR